MRFRQNTLYKSLYFFFKCKIKEADVSDTIGFIEEINNTYGDWRWGDVDQIITDIFFGSLDQEKSLEVYRYFEEKLSKFLTEELESKLLNTSNKYGKNRFALFFIDRKFFGYESYEKRYNEVFRAELRLRRAVERRDREEVYRFLDEKILRHDDIKYSEMFYSLLTQMLSYFDCSDMVDSLIDKYNFFADNPQNYIKFMSYLARKGGFEALKILIDRKVVGYEKFLKYFEQKEINRIFRRLCYLFKTGNVRDLHSFIKNKNIDVNSDPIRLDFYDALDIAATEGFYDLLVYLVENYDLSIEIPELSWGRTPLESAIISGNFLIVQYLIGKHRGIDFSDSLGNVEFYEKEVFIEIDSDDEV